MRGKRLLVLSRTGVPSQRLRLDPGRLDHVEQRPGDGRGIEVIEEHRQVRLAVNRRRGSGSKYRDSGPGALDVEGERAEFAKPELHQHAQPVYRGIQRFVLEEVDAGGQVHAVRVGGVVAHLEMTKTASDPLREQREGALYIGEVDHYPRFWG